jgi:hypothetical protein
LTISQTRPKPDEEGEAEGKALLRRLLLTLNFSWTALLLVVGGLVLYAATAGPANPFIRTFVFVAGLFWAIHGAYIWLVPMPLPPRLQWVGLALAAFPATLIALHWVPLGVYRSVSSRNARGLSRAQLP